MDLTVRSTPELDRVRELAHRAAELGAKVERELAEYIEEGRHLS